MILMDNFNNLEYSSALESSSEAQAWLAEQNTHFGHFINGSWLHNETADTMPVTNPANAEQIAPTIKDTATIPFEPSSLLPLK